MMLDRLLRWLAEPYVDEVRALWVEDVTRKQQEAYNLGIAQGQAFGQRQAFAELERLVETRHPVVLEITSEDIARAKKGMVH